MEHGKVFPWSGWSLESEDDLGDLTGSCDLCDTSIRYEFHITHPKWFPLVVGTDCCDKLTESDAASLIVREGKRVTRFIASSRWKTTARGIGIRQMTMDFEIVSEATAHFILFDGIRGKVSYATLENAKIGLFDFVESGEAAEFLKKRRAKQSRPRTVKMQDRGISPC